jgi:cell division protein FtsB
MNKNHKPFISADLIVMAAFVLLGFSMIWNTTKVIYRNYELQQQVDELEAEIAVLDIENQNLKFNIEYYKTDTFLELEAREKFNKAKSGESVALLPKDLSVQQDQKPDIEEFKSSQFKSNFSAWWEFLFGRIN